MKGALEISTKKLTIGMMNGLAYGGGAVLASSLDMRIGCEATKFRFLAAAYGRINLTGHRRNCVGWPMAKELPFSACIVEAEEAYRIGLLNHLRPRQSWDKTMKLAKIIAGNHTGAVTGVKELMLRGLAGLSARTGIRDRLRQERDAGRQGRGCLPRFHCPQGARFPDGESTMQTRPLTESFGIRIEGVDLLQPLSEDAFAQLRPWDETPGCRDSRPKARR